MVCDPGSFAFMLNGSAARARAIRALRALDRPRETLMRGSVILATIAIAAPAAAQLSPSSVAVEKTGSCRRAAIGSIVTENFFDFAKICRDGLRLTSVAIETDAPSHGTAADGTAGATISAKSGGFYGTTKSTDIQAAYIFNTNSYNLNATSANGFQNAYFGINVDGKNTRGNVTALVGLVNVSQSTSNLHTDPFYYTALAGNCFASVNDGGTRAQPSGNCFGGNVIVQIRRGATNWNSAVGFEDDIEVQSGASVLDVIGHQVVLTKNHAVAGTRANTAFAITRQPGASQGFTCAYCVGGPNGHWPMAANSNVIAALSSAMGGEPAHIVKNVVNSTNMAVTDAVLRASDGQKVCLNSTESSTDACIYHRGNKLYYDVGGVHMMSIEDGTGNLVLKGTLMQNGKP